MNKRSRIIVFCIFVAFPLLLFVAINIFNERKRTGSLTVPMEWFALYVLPVLVILATAILGIIKSRKKTDEKSSTALTQPLDTTPTTQPQNTINNTDNVDIKNDEIDKVMAKKRRKINLIFMLIYIIVFPLSIFIVSKFFSDTITAHYIWIICTCGGIAHVLMLKKASKEEDNISSNPNKILVSAALSFLSIATSILVIFTILYGCANVYTLVFIDPNYLLIPICALLNLYYAKGVPKKWLIVAWFLFAVCLGLMLYSRSIAPTSSPQGSQAVTCNII